MKAGNVGGKTMRKVLGFALTTVLLLSFTSCTGQDQTNGNRTTTANAPAPATPSNTPATPPTTPAPPAPTTANVKATPGLKWQDDASGTPVTTIKVGGTVTWTVTAGAPHSLQRVAPSPGNGCDELDVSFDTPGHLTPGQPVTRTFTKVGTFGYRCGVHLGTPDCKS